MALYDYLQNMNPAQLQAVQHPPNISLQILAGPGSGKTKVLTSRIAHLIAHHSLEPSAICAVTFTNKAANEMRERLTKLIGKERTNEIKMGTFHALCAKFLRRHAQLIQLEGNFTIFDADESKKIIKKLLKPYHQLLADENIAMKEGMVMSCISKAKAKGKSPDDLFLEAKNNLLPSARRERTATGWEQIVATIYRDYQRVLRKNNSLDFDDLLVFGVQLFGRHPVVGKWCRHVLVDEFQDTNSMQYELMCYIAAASKCVTVVGDPDQSIYGWRSAEVENLARMQKDFPSTRQILLEQNYRSTASILTASIAIVSEDKARIPKTLHTTHPIGIKPLLKKFPSEYMESSFIATEIKRLVASTGGMLGWNDFVILLRYNSLSRAIESALQRESIPNRVLGGHKFFERLEIKDLLAYLQLVDNPQFVPAFARVVNVPSRSIGEKTLSEILRQADILRLSPLEFIEQIHDGHVSDIKPPLKRKLGDFVKAIRTLRSLTQRWTSPADLIRRLLDLIKYEDHLRKTQPDWESRWDNVQELITFAVQSDIAPSARDDTRVENPVGEWGDALAEVDHDEFDDVDLSVARSSRDVKGKRRAIAEQDEEELTPLRFFLQASMLSTDTQTQDEDSGKGKVTISTCHAAKGLEWPVVFIPAVEIGTFPSARAEDVEEERRLLYVACTRAQGLLYLSHSASRMIAGKLADQYLSEFITVPVRNNRDLFSPELPTLSQKDRQLIAQVLNRAPPDESEVTRKLYEYQNALENRQETIEVHQIGGPLPQPRSYNWTAPPQDVNPAAMSTFQSSRLVMHAAKLPVAVPSNQPAALPPPPSPHDRRVTASSHAIRTSVQSPAKPTFNRSEEKPQSRSQENQVFIHSCAMPNLRSEKARSSPTKPAQPLPPQTISISKQAAPKVCAPSNAVNIPKSNTGLSRFESTNNIIPDKMAQVPPQPQETYKPYLARRPTAIAPYVTPPRSSLESSSSATPGSMTLPFSSSSDLPSPIQTVELAKPMSGSKKRRLGMGRTVVGYPNKKFKAPS